MHCYGVRYGFLTTYEETVFLEQKPHPSKTGKWVLWVSPIIKHSTRSRPVHEIGEPSAYRGYVSLRECFLYMMRLAAQNPQAKNQMGRDAWVSKRRGKADPDDIISDHSDSYGSEQYQPRPTKNPRTASSRGPSGRQTADRTHDIERLTQGMSVGNSHSRLYMKNRNTPYPIHFSRSENEYYVQLKDGSRKYVGTQFYKDEDREGKYMYYVKGDQKIVVVLQT